MKKTITIYLLFLGIIFLLPQCDKTGNVNIFSLEDELELGRMMDSTVNSDYEVLPKSQYASAYAYLNSIKEDILKSDDILYPDELVWKVTILRDDEVLNAFATPGGYFYIFTGIIKYLDNAANLAGVMGHEIAHSDRRHATHRLTKVYGASLLLDIVLGKEQDRSQLANIVLDLAMGLGNLYFTRDQEYEADEYAIKYNVSTKYDPKGIAGFFNQLETDNPNTSNPPEFLSTHPNPDNRLERIDEIWTQLNQPSGGEYVDEYNNFKALLP